MVEELNEWVNGAEFISNQIDEKLFYKLDCYDQAVCAMLETYFVSRPPSGEKKKQIIEVIDNCSKRADRAPTEKMHDYIYKHLSELIDDLDARKQFLQVIDETREY